MSLNRIFLSVAVGAALLGCDDGDGDAPMDPITLVDMAIAPDAGGEPEPMPDAGGAADMAPDMMQGEPAYTATLDLPAEPYDYDTVLPQHYREETLGFAGQRPATADDNTPGNNPLTDAGATLGRVLFYDKNLSANRTVACASCHKAELGFSDDAVLSEGFEGGQTRRHSMGLVNARFYRSRSFFWDQRAATLEDQVLMPFQDEVEMGMTLDGLIARVEAGDYYPPLFEAAFGDPEVTAGRISRALAQFVRSIVSVSSRYDEGRAQVGHRLADFPNFNAAENRGKWLFSNVPPNGGLGCFFCHQGEAFVAIEATNNGLEADFSGDRGYGEVTGEFRDGSTFKVPSLRNVELRPPYMHDGRFATLEEVIEHYSEDVQRHPNLGPPLIGLGSLRLSDPDKAALVAFLKTLTDHSLAEDPRFLDPFVADE